MCVMKTPLLRVTASPDIGVTIVLSNLNTMAVLGGKFAPLTMTSEPTGPWEGESGSRLGLAVTVKEAVTVVLPTIAAIVWAPAEAVDGIVTVLIKLPPLV